jgi:hypothetical protein
MKLKSPVETSPFRMNQLVTPSFLFRWSFAVPHIETIPNRTGRLLDLPEACRLPSVGELDGRRDFADVRLAWNSSGLGVSVDVRGRSKKLITAGYAPNESDGLTLWIDTRNTQGVHRATKFCHQFCLLPAGGGRKEAEPIAVQIQLARAREEATLDTSLVELQSSVEKTGYYLEAWFPTAAFVGFDPATSPRLGFHYRLRDLELGDQTLVGPEFPVESDPSLWQTLELVS